MSVSVIIPNLNGSAYIDACINSLLKQTLNNFEIIVVDNGSIDESVEIIKKYKEVILIQNESNMGFPYAVNQGIQEAKYDLIALLNNDTVADPCWLEMLVNEMAIKPDAFSVQSLMIRYNEREIIDDAGDGYTLLGWAYKIGDGKLKYKYSHTKRIFSSCAGAALYRKTLLLEVGLFDNSFFAYLEDVDISFRGTAIGYHHYLCPQSIVYHIGSASSGGKHNDFKVYLSARNNIWLIKKNIPLLLIFINSPMLILGCIIKLLFFWKKGFAKTYINGIKDGLRRFQPTPSMIKPSISTSIRMEFLLIYNTIMYVFDKMM